MHHSSAHVPQGSTGKPKISEGTTNAKREVKSINLAIRLQKAGFCHGQVNLSKNPVEVAQNNKDGGTRPRSSDTPLKETNDEINEIFTIFQNQLITSIYLIYSNSPQLYSN